MRNGGLALLQGWKEDTVTRFAPFDEGGQGLEGDEEHLGEGEGGTYCWALPEKLLVCPYIPEESNTVISMRELRVNTRRRTSNNHRI
jgi:hypothetical protein